MKALFTYRGQKTLVDVHEPLMDSYSVKVKLHYSAISFGTENINREGTTLLSQVKNKNFWKKGLEILYKKKNPLQLINKIKSVRNTYNAIGYSAVGEVLEIGKNVYQPLKKGDIVHVGGERAFHAEMVVCPQNFVFKLDEKHYQIHPSLYSLATIISVPMHAFLHAKQALLQAPPYSALVIGGGLIGTFAGLIAKQQKFNTHFDDPIETPLASSFLDRIIPSTPYDLILCCATSASGLDNYISLCREGAVLALVGEIPLQLDRSLLEDKYMTVRFCKSFGFGRGNQAYEYGLEEPNPFFPNNIRQNILKSIEHIDTCKHEMIQHPERMQVLRPEEVSKQEDPRKINIIQWSNHLS